MPRYRGMHLFTCVGILFRNLAVEAANLGDPSGEFMLTAATSPRLGLSFASEWCTI